MAITHFGAYEDVERQLEEVRQRLAEWSQRVREQDRDTFITGIGEQIRAHAAAGLEAAYGLAAPPDQLYAGLERYWRKRAEAEASPASPSVA